MPNGVTTYRKDLISGYRLACGLLPLDEAPAPPDPAPPPAPPAPVAAAAGPPEGPVVPYQAKCCSWTCVSLKVAYSISWPLSDIQIALFAWRISSAECETERKIEISACWGRYNAAGLQVMQIGLFWVSEIFLFSSKQKGTGQLQCTLERSLKNKYLWFQIVGKHLTRQDLIIYIIITISKIKYLKYLKFL